MQKREHRGLLEAQRPFGSSNGVNAIMRQLLKSFYEKLGALYSRCQRYLSIAACICIFLMMVTMAPDSFLRKFLDFPLPGVLEFNELLMVASVYLAVAWAEHEEKHVRVTIVVSRLPNRAQSWVRVFSVGLSLFFFGFLAVAGIKEAYVSILSHETKWGLIQFPVAPSRVCLALGCTFMCFELCGKLVRTISDAVSGRFEKKKSTPTIDFT